LAEDETVDGRPLEEDSSSSSALQDVGPPRDGGDRVNGVDLKRLRAGRLARLQGAMRRHDVDACLLFNEPNVRYATGASAMPVWSNTSFVRCALVPARGLPILFEHPNSMHLFGELEADVRPMHAWEFTDDVPSHATIFARETIAAMRELGVTDDLLAIDRLGTPGFLALQAAGISILDSARVTMEAREIKTPEEIEVLAMGGQVVTEMLRDFEAAIRPGITERELLAVLAGALLAGGGEHLATNTVCSGPHTTPGGPRRLPERSNVATWSTSTPTRCAWRATSSASRGRSCAATPPLRESNVTRIERHTTGWRRRRISCALG